MHTVMNVYIGNLAMADVIIAVFCIPFQFQAALLNRWDLPAFMCKVCPFLQVNIIMHERNFELTDEGLEHVITIDHDCWRLFQPRAYPRRYIDVDTLTALQLINFESSSRCRHMQ
jgi:hypothetical protein